MNMPEVDTYYTIQAHTIVRQFMDYSSWYDRSDFVLKDIQKCQFVGAFNPTSGSFTIDPRLQRWFSTFAVNEPNDMQIRSIYFNILSQYLNDPLNELSKGVTELCDNIVDASIRLHKRMIKMFLPTAQKFHYFFNMRDLTNIFQGLLWATKECCPNAKSMIRLWAHESTRVYCDKLITLEDNAQFEVQLKETIDESFTQVQSDTVLQKPLILFHFAESLNDAKYMPIKDWKGLNRNLMTAMENYNEFIGDMNLVFDSFVSSLSLVFLTGLHLIFADTFRGCNESHNSHQSNYEQRSWLRYVDWCWWFWKAIAYKTYRFHQYTGTISNIRSQGIQYS